MPQPKRYASRAEQMRAYRARKRQADADAAQAKRDDATLRRYVYQCLYRATRDTIARTLTEQVGSLRDSIRRDAAEKLQRELTEEERAALDQMLQEAEWQIGGNITR